MKRILLCFVTFVLMITISLSIYATQETEGIIEEEQIFDDIQEDSEFEEINLENEEQQTEKTNKFKIIVFVIFLIDCCLIIKRIGINKKLLSIILGTIFGLISGIIMIIILKEENIQELFKFVSVAFLGIYIFVAQYVVINLDNLKNKTEDVLWKKIFVQGLKVESYTIIEIIAGIFLICSGIEMIYFNNSNITSAALYIAGIGAVGTIMVTVFSTLFYSIMNSKKTIYKTKSVNKLDGNRSLKV